MRLECPVSCLSSPDWICHLKGSVSSSHVIFWLGTILICHAALGFVTKKSWIEANCFLPNVFFRTPVTAGWKQNLRSFLRHQCAQSLKGINVGLRRVRRADQHAQFPTAEVTIRGSGHDAQSRLLNSTASSTSCLLHKRAGERWSRKWVQRIVGSHNGAAESFKLKASTCPFVQTVWPWVSI